LIDPSLYSNVEVSKEGEMILISFTNPSAAEKWALPDDAVFVEANGQVLVNPDGSVSEMRYTIRYENLVSDDVSTAKAYKSGDGTVIEMLMVEQVSGAYEDANSGSVGHAITTIGDISTVVKDLNDRGLSIELSENEEDTKIYYTNPVVNVVINDNGEIVKGTWSYTVEICMNNFKAFGKEVEKASIVMENTITV
jgi:hypothetical protein